MTREPILLIGKRKKTYFFRYLLDFYDCNKLQKYKKKCKKIV